MAEREAALNSKEIALQQREANMQSRVAALEDGACIKREKLAHEESVSAQLQAELGEKHGKLSRIQEAAAHQRQQLQQLNSDMEEIEDSMPCSICQDNRPPQCSSPVDTASAVKLRAVTQHDKMRVLSCRHCTPQQGIRDWVFGAGRPGGRCCSRARSQEQLAAQGNNSSTTSRGDAIAADEKQAVRI